MPDVRCKQLGSLSPVTPVREIEMPSYDSAGVGCVVRGLSEQDARRLENWVDKNDCCDGSDWFHNGFPVVVGLTYDYADNPVGISSVLGDKSRKCSISIHLYNKGPGPSGSKGSLYRIPEFLQDRCSGTHRDTLVVGNHQNCEL